MQGLSAGSLAPGRPPSLSGLSLLIWKKEKGTKTFHLVFPPGCLILRKKPNKFALWV